MNNDYDDEFMLTTKDNPFNPFTNFDEWFAYDLRNGYNTCGLLARFAKTSTDLSLSEQKRIYDTAIDDVIKNDLQHIYLKITKDYNPTENMKIDENIGFQETKS